MICYNKFYFFKGEQILPKSIWTLLLICFISLHAHDFGLNRQALQIGPEIYHLKRIRKGGTEQSGTLYGISASYNRLKRYGWYIGLEGSFATGTIKGHTGNDSKISSRFKDQWAEARFGYTFQQKEGCELAFTPFIGLGYAQENNHFKNPSPLPIHFKTRYGYANWGFLTWAHLFCDWETGLNFHMRIPYNPECKATNDPLHAPVTQNIGERLQYKVELPITYRAFSDDRFVVVFEPFYEYRLYGSHVNYPFDYFKTKLNLWGAMLKLEFRFCR